jgi:small subunit ribosomal protein S27e
MAKAADTKEAKFVAVKCPDCNNKQTIFVKAATKIACQACGSTLATPTGGKCVIKGEVVEVVE